ncbi:putative signal peptide protein [Puccinia sorghi]|uniref:Putative signal peptide protein n=1 Tax=Puccinia sorghi TaxID=27349 RepID=A0A0L6VEJ8_9BASI|nr:putative signal peptide protein [Puccinia sorghi]
MKAFMAITAHGISPKWNILDLLVAVPAVKGTTHWQQLWRPPCGYPGQTSAFRKAHQHYGGKCIK